MALNALRICSIKIAVIFDIQSQGKGGVFNRLSADLLSTIEKDFNVTRVSTIENTIYGCINSIKRNESDFALAFAYDDIGFPDGVMPWTTWASTHQMIGTVYRNDYWERDGSKINTRVLDFVEGYSATHWIVTIVTAFIFFAIMVIAYMLKEVDEGTELPTESDGPASERVFASRADWEVTASPELDAKSAAVVSVQPQIRPAISKTLTFFVSCILNQHGNCGNMELNGLLSMIYTILTLLCYFTAYFLTSMIKTEMVTLNAPPTLETYQDLIDHDVIPTWLQEFSDERDFAASAAGTKERAIWDRAVERGLDQSIISGPKLLAHPFELAAGAMNHTRVAMTYNVATEIMIQVICHMMWKEEGFREYRKFSLMSRRDEDARETIRSVFGSSAPESDRMRRRVNYRMRSQMERIPFAKILPRAALYEFAGVDKYNAGVANCTANVVLYPYIELSSVVLHHYWDLFTLCSITIVIAFIFLRLEKVFVPVARVAPLRSRIAMRRIIRRSQTAIAHTRTTHTIRPRSV